MGGEEYFRGPDFKQLNRLPQWPFFVSLLSC